MGGMGMLGVPSAFKLCGWAAIAAFVFLGAALCWTSILISSCIDCAAGLVPEEERNGAPLDWPILGQAVGGKLGRRIVRIIFVGQLFCFNITNLVVNAENLSVLFPWASRIHLILISAVLVFVMLFSPKKLLAPFSFTGMLAIAMLFVALMISGFAVPEAQDAHEYSILEIGALPEVMSIAVFCFAAHASIPAIYINAGSSESSRKTYVHATVSAYIISTVIYVVVGVLGYFFYAAATQDNVADNISRDIDMHMIPGLGYLRPLTAVFLIVKLQSAFPLCSQPLVDEIEAVMRFTEDTSCIAKVLVKVSLIAIATVLTVVLRDDMHAVMGLTGALFAMSTSLVLPTAFYIKLKRKGLPFWQVAVLGLMCAGGVCFQLLGTLSAVKELLGK